MLDNMRILIKNGRVIDPANKIDAVKDIYISKGIIREVADSIDMEADKIIDAGGKWVMPGFVDMHSHLREPGAEHKETIRTGLRAAARGGYTALCMMPDTKPCIDSVEMVDFIKERAEELSYIDILPVAAVTAGQDGEFITDFEKLYANGAVAVTEDGKTIVNARTVRQAMKLAADVGIPMFAHCIDVNLAKNGVMHAGKRARELGFYGLMDVVEDTIISRDLLLARSTDCQLHVCHITTESAVWMVEQAKELGAKISCEVTPHHLVFTDMDISGDDPDFKTLPPIRSAEDRNALRKALSSGIIDCIATDHAPHHESEKALGFEQAPFGASGLETAVSVVVSELVHTGVITPSQMVEKMSLNPSRILSLDRGTLSVGASADITIVDPELEYTIDSSAFASKGKNTPFDGRKVKGRVVATIAKGRLVYRFTDGKDIISDKDDE